MAGIAYQLNKFLIVDSLPLFSELSPLQKRLVSSKSDAAAFKKGEVIYEEGARVDYFYCVISGRVEIFHPSHKTRNHKEFIIECVRRGDYFGSISSLTGKPHTVSARALNDSLLLRINKKNFDYLLRKIPKLAIFLSRSLSRRLGRKGLKEIFESRIIAVYSALGAFDASRYAENLKKQIEKQSGKKALVAKFASIRRAKDVASKLSLLTGKHHFILVDCGNNTGDVGFEILRQADTCHILTPSDKLSLSRAVALIKKIENSLISGSKQEVSVIIKEDVHYNDTSYADKVKILFRGVLASLPDDKAGYKKAVRRVARQVSGVTIGLALGSGAAMGLAHIGVLKVLEEENISIDMVAGTSMGALIAAFWAAGYSADEIAVISRGFKSRLKTMLLIDPAIPVRGLIKGRIIKKFLESHLGNKTFLDVRLPLKISACDVVNRKEFIIDRGRLADAVMASIAVPGLFEPVKFDSGRLSVDGGIVNPVPVSVLAMSGIKRIIAVNTLPSPEDVVRIRRKKPNIYDIIVNSFQAMEYTIAETSYQQADVTIHPVPSFADWYEFYKADVFIKAGRNEARLALQDIKKLALA